MINSRKRPKFISQSLWVKGHLNQASFLIELNILGSPFDCTQIFHKKRNECCSSPLPNTPTDWSSEGIVAWEKTRHDIASLGFVFAFRTGSCHNSCPVCLILVLQKTKQNLLKAPNCLIRFRRKAYFLAKLSSNLIIFSTHQTSGELQWVRH